jgi:hypothetical protein
MASARRAVSAIVGQAEADGGAIATAKNRAADRKARIIATRSLARISGARAPHHAGA